MPDQVEIDPSDYLLTQDDLPGWKYARQINFAPEPTFEVVDCDLMVAAWSAQAIAGTRVRASTDGVALRNTVVEMPDTASAEAILDGADLAWRECNPLMLDTGDAWWVEPIQVPEVEGWRSTGLALGVSDDYIWSIAWFQRGPTVVILDLDSANPWPVLDPVLEAVAGRLAGDPSPVPTADRPVQSTTTSTVPDTIPGERPPLTTLPANPDDEWRDHPGAVYVPDPALFGSGFSLDRVLVEEPAPSNPDQVIESCPVDPPPTMDGLRIELRHESDKVEVEVLIGLDNEVWAQDTVDAFRSLGFCGADALEVNELTVIEPDSAADDAVIMEVSISDGVGLTRGLVLVARYGDMMIGVVVGVESGSSVDLPTVEELTQWADTIAASS